MTSLWIIWAENRDGRLIQAASADRREDAEYAAVLAARTCPGRQVILEGFNAAGECVSSEDYSVSQ